MSQDASLWKIGENTPFAGPIVLVAVGSNKFSTAGNPRETVIAALQEFESRGGVIRNCSPIYRTPAFPPGSGDDYANAVFACDPQDKSPQDYLDLLQAVEAAFGRTRTDRWGPRTLDLDLLTWGKHIAPDRDTLDAWMDLPAELQSQTAPDTLILPHPRIQDRAFVLVPMADVASEWRHPALDMTVAQMRDRLPAYHLDEVRLYK